MNELLLQRRALMMAQKKSRLPSAYQEVEYLKSDRTQYIDTLFADTEGGYCTLIVTYNLFGNYHMPCGAENQTAGTSRNIFCSSAGGKLSFGAGGTSPSSDVSIVTGTKYTIETSTVRGDSWMKIDGTKKATSADSNPRTSLSLYLFAGHKGNAAAANLYFGGKLYSCILSDHNGVGVRHFIPCYRKADNVKGMYDILGSICPLTNSPFYIKSTGNDFVAGPNVN